MVERMAERMPDQSNDARTAQGCNRETTSSNNGADRTFQHFFDERMVSHRADGESVERMAERMAPSGW